MNRQMLVPIGVLGAVMALIGLLVVLGQQEQQQAPGAPAKAAAAAKDKPRAKAKAPKKMKAAELTHIADPIVERADAPEGAPNIVLVTVDSFRRDQLSVYGGPAETTPFLARMAEGGARFDDTIAAGPWGRPALVTLTTGQHATTVGMIQPGDEGNQRKLAEGVTTLAERLQAAGWYTAGVTANFNNNRLYGMAQGFDAWRDSHPAAFNPGTRLAADEAVDEVFRLVDARPEALAGRPAFVQLSLVDLHKPFMVPKEEFEPFESEGHNIAPYRAMLKRTDDALEKLVDGLGSRGLTPSNTIVMVIGAHGEGLSMPKHHGRQHGRTLFRSSIQVPWVVAGPGVAKGHVVTGLSHQADVLPTVLGLTGVEVGEERLAGLDLAPLVKGESSAIEREAVFTETWYFTANHAAVYTADKVCQKDFGTTGGQAITTGCYDRQADPDGASLEESADDPLLAELVAWREARWAEYDAWPEVGDAK